MILMQYERNENDSRKVIEIAGGMHTQKVNEERANGWKQVLLNWKTSEGVYAMRSIGF